MKDDKSQFLKKFAIKGVKSSDFDTAMKGKDKIPNKPLRKKVNNST